MDITKIITIAGKSGLHRIIAQGRQALIVESLTDTKRFAVPLSVRVSSLEEISMFTTGDDVPLKDVLTKLHEVAKGGASADPKEDDDSLWAALLKALPEADKERIYSSDVRKLFTWYGQLLKSGDLDKKEEKAKGGKKEAEAAKTAASGKEDGKAKKAAPKKKAAAAGKGGPKPGGGSGAPKAAAVRRGGQRGS